MKLSQMLSKLKVLSLEMLGSKESENRNKPQNSTIPLKFYGNPKESTIIIKENKGNVLIKCWRCGKESWVKKGSPCHNEGLCSKCV